MATPQLQEEERDDLDLVDRWFRALDQRRIFLGMREWLVHVTGVYVDEGDVWIQIADGSSAGGSVVLRVSATTPTEDALRALTTRGRVTAPAYPQVVCALTRSSLGESHHASALTR